MTKVSGYSVYIVSKFVQNIQKNKRIFCFVYLFVGIVFFREEKNENIRKNKVREVCHSLSEFNEVLPK